MADMNYLPDIYKITDTVQSIQKNYIEEDDVTLTMGIYGYLNEVNANALQNAILLAAEYGNEALPIRAKYERTILTNAITYDVKDINAQPAVMKVMLGFLKSNLDSFLDSNKQLVIDRYCDLAIEEYDFHLDYDLIITRRKLMNGNIIYSARYDLSFDNGISDITNPYLQSPIITSVQGDEYLFVICDIRQTSLDILTNKIITNNILESKTFDFQFENQLCDFNVFVKENGVTTKLTPIYEGMPSTTEKFCYYTYVNENTIRVKFDRKSYQPALNCEITVEVYTTLGSAGNFSYSKILILPLESENYDYRNIKAIIRPMASSTNGRDRKSVNELKRIIPKRMLARAGIINTKDLQNYFDMLDVDNRLIVFKKRDNQIERLYYAYLLAKDENSDIVPTNTIEINLNTENFDIIYKDRYILKPGRQIFYDKNEVGYYDKKLIGEEEKLTECECGCGCLMGERHPIFTYASPFITVVNKSPLSISYYLDVINDTYIFDYDYINQQSAIQFVSTNINLSKNYLISDDYVFRMSFTQNSTTNADIVIYEKDEEGNKTGVISDILLKPVLAININGTTYYVKGDIVNFVENTFTYETEFRLSTNSCLINEKNQVQIVNLIRSGESREESVFVDEIIHISVYAFLENSLISDKDTTYNPDIVVPEYNTNYSVVNKYLINEDMHLFYNYSSTINSVCKVNKPNEGTETESYNFSLKSIPLIRHDYINNSYKLNEFISYLQYRKSYIDKAQEIMEDSFNIDLKFFNTYGPSKLFKIGRKSEELDRVNLTLNFIVKLILSSNAEVIYSIKDSIKAYIEDINKLTSVHMSNICSHIKQQYDSDIDFIEFVGMNHYNSNYQYIERHEPDILTDVPEFINVNLNADLEPDINITII